MGMGAGFGSRIDRVGRWTALATVLVLVLPAPALPQTAAPSADCPSEVGPDAAVWVTGVVRDAGSEVVLPGAEVTLTWEGPDGLRTVSTATDASGVYRFCHLRSGERVTLQVAVAGRVGEAVPLDVPSGETAIRQHIAVLLSGAAQSRVVGRIVDGETGRGVEAATVRVDPAGMETVSRHDGGFRISGVPVGEHELVLHHVAYGRDTFSVEVVEGRTADVEIRVRQQAVQMQPLEVEVKVVQRYRTLERRGFYDRIHTAQAHGGVFLTPELIERRNPARLSHLLSQVPRVRLRKRCRGSVCGYWPDVGTCGQPTIFLDGSRFRIQGVKGIDELPMPDVRAVEIYMGPAELPMEFSSPGARCAIAVWTKMGPDRRREGDGSP